MKDKIINFETAKLAKEKGFKISCHSYYFEDEEFRENKIETINGYYGDTVIYGQEDFYENWNDAFLTAKNGDRCFGCNSQRYFETYSAPSQSLLQKWLREKHKIVIYIQPKIHLYYEWHIITTDNHIISSERSYDWEELLESALYESLKLIDNNL